MTPIVYRFRNFRLDPQARELHQDDALLVLPVSTLDCLIYLIRHRDRSVGRDELTAAVWGRVDVSEVSLSHAIMRLRRLLGDTGSEQNSIRTLPRLGYRWIVEPTIEQAPPPSPSARQPRSRRPGLVLLLLAFVAVGALALWPHWRSTQQTGADAPSILAKRLPAMVLPAEVAAAGDWAWLRLGLMDLLANRLRQGGLATTPSETVVSLANAHRFDALDDTVDGMVTLLVRPRVALANGQWNVRLQARGDGRDLIVEAHGADVLVVGRAAADDLLVKLGRTPLAEGGDDPSRAAEELAQRVSAAVLAGQLQVARDLIHNAAPAAQASHQVALSIAKIEFFSGEYEASRKHAEALLDRLPAEKYPLLRARTLYTLGVTYFRQERSEDADAAFAEAIDLLGLRNDSDLLAAVYTGRGVVAGKAQRLDEAAAFLGQARTLHEMNNDTFGVARVDLNLGAVALDRGQPAAAVPIFEDAVTRFESLATPEALNSALRSLADAQSMLLDHDKALATTERFWPPEAHSRNPREDWWLTLSRAVALAGVGRLRDADDLIRRVRTSSDPTEDAVARIEAEYLAANLALQRGDYALAAALATKALQPVLESTNWQDYLGAWLVRVRALQRDGQVAAAADEVKRLRGWANASAGERNLFYAVLAEAAQAQCEGSVDVSLQRYADAMARAERLGIPEDIVVVGELYVETLLAAGKLDQASAISGRLARWADKDMRVAWTQAQVYQALHKTDAARRTLERARQLAGERILFGDRSVEPN